jgi:hypothetical protein
MRDSVFFLFLMSMDIFFFFFVLIPSEKSIPSWNLLAKESIPCEGISESVFLKT